MTFKPTKEQLEKLAKVAKVDYKIQDDKLWMLTRPNNWTTLFEPENDRDQIAMVIEGLTDQQEDDYDALLYKHWKSNYKYNPLMSVQTVHPSISCEKLLEVL